MAHLLHLSDIHFQGVRDATGRNIDDAVRADLLQDLRRLAEDLPDFDLVLVVGDLAATGKAPEFERAAEFLEDTCKIVGTPSSQVVCVPGNHDVDRDEQDPLHGGLRRLLRTTDPEGVVDALEWVLQDASAAEILHRPFSAYNDLARSFGCEVTGARPVWPPKDLDLGGRTLRIRGVNSALVCDGTEGHERESDRLILGANQLAALAEDHDVVSMLLCHHPLRWLRDADHVSPWLNRAHILLTGHEHSLGIRTSPDGRSVAIEAGAVNPERTSADWAPAYNILDLSADDTTLEVGVRVRTYGQERAGFVADPRFGDRHQLAVPLSRAGTVEPEETEPVEVLAPEPVVSENRAMIHRVLRVAPDIRAGAARQLGLLAEDDLLADPEAERALLRRTQDQGKLSALRDLLDGN